MKAAVDRNLCQGHAMCNALAPEVYEVNDDGFNEMGVFAVPVGREAAAARGAGACPERAITIIKNE